MTESLARERDDNFVRVKIKQSWYIQIFTHTQKRRELEGIRAERNNVSGAHNDLELDLLYL